MKINETTIENFKESANERFGDSVRVVAHADFDEDTYDIVYIREDIKDKYTEEELESVYVDKATDWFLKQGGFPGEIEMQVNYYDDWNSVIFFLDGAALYLLTDVGTLNRDKLEKFQHSL